MSPAAITLNGDAAEVEEGSTLGALVDGLGADRARIVVEHNRRIVRGAELDATVVAEGDEVEVMQLVGGGA